jgi:glycosyltransferase involved in cell wall biosynthesis
MRSDVNSSDIAAIIPCCNKALTIAKVIDDFHREPPEATVYAYDNNSTDSTAQIAREHGASV